MKNRIYGKMPFIYGMKVEISSYVTVGNRTSLTKNRQYFRNWVFPNKNGRKMVHVHKEMAGIMRRAKSHVTYLFTWLYLFL
jgi:hypothetical protein